MLFVLNQRLWRRDLCPLAGGGSRCRAGGAQPQKGLEGRGREVATGPPGPLPAGEPLLLCLTQVARDRVNETKTEVVPVIFWGVLLLMTKTMPSNGLPSTQLVEKKAMFLVSRGFSFVKSGDLVWGSDSPVSEELSTCR